MRWRVNTSLPIVGFALALGLLITTVLLGLAFKNLMQDEEAAFEVQVGTIKDGLVQRLTSADEVLHSMRVLFDASSSVDDDEFQIVANDTLSNYPFIKAVIYLPLITHDERGYFEKSKHEEGYPTFSINSLRDGRYVPAQQQPTYFPILYTEPFTPLASQQLGLDLFGAPETRPYIQQAIDSGASTAVISTQVSHADEYLALKAVYAGTTKPNLDEVHERRKLISGIVAIKMDARQLLSTNQLDDHISVAIYARPVLNSKKLVNLFNYEGLATKGGREHWRYGDLAREREIVIGEQHFVIKLRKSLHFEAFKYQSMMVALFAGLLFTLLLWFLAKSIRARAEDLQRRNEEIQQLVELKTHELASEKERALITLESIADAVITADSKGIIDYLNPVAERLSGWPEQEAVGKPIVDLFKVFDEKSLEEVANPVLQCLQNGLPFMRQENTVFINRNGDTVAINESAAPILDKHGNITGVVLVFHDVSSTRKLTQQMSYQATHDALTGLPNRILLMDHLETELELAQQRGRSLAVMFLDLDRFKIVNDTLGHDVGDELLQQVADRLKACLREGDIVSRLGGDEFVIVMSEIKSNHAAQLLAERVLKSFHTPFKLGQSEFFTSTSIGISVYPEGGMTSEELMKNADSAMYRVKAEGKNNYLFYSPKANQRTKERFSLEADLRRALERQELVLHYQPQVNVKTGKVTGLEALIRWNHPTLGMIPPMEFLPLAEETGLIVDIGHWVMHQACSQNQAWQQMGLPKVTVAVNIAHKQFIRPTLVSDVKNILHETGLDPRFLELELTEGILADNSVESNKRLSELKAAGVKLSIDDFGTGYSSLFYLKTFPIDSVKIDRCFIKDIETDRNDAEISAAIIAMSHNLNLEVVAEGVESEFQLDFLRRKGCDTIQGFYYSPAVPAEMAITFLEKPITGKSQLS